MKTIEVIKNEIVFYQVRDERWEFRDVKEKWLYSES